MLAEATTFPTSGPPRPAPEAAKIYKPCTNYVRPFSISLKNYWKPEQNVYPFMTLLVHNGTF